MVQHTAQSLPLQDKGHTEKCRTAFYNKHLCKTQQGGKQIPVSVKVTLLLQDCQWNLLRVIRKIWLH